jgi:hypothetical protein
MKRGVLFISIILFQIFSSALAQNKDTLVESPTKKVFKLRPIRLGAKIGYPNLVGGNVEYVPKLLKNRFSVSLDYSHLNSDSLESQTTSIDGSNSSFDFSYLNAGFNYYIFKPGKGLYTGLRYGNIKFKGEDSSITNKDGDYENPGTEYYDVSNKSMNVLLGARWGGLVYFRPEIGYSFNPIPESIESDIIYKDGTREKENYNLIEEGFLDPLKTGLLFNFGFGFAF